MKYEVNFGNPVSGAKSTNPGADNVFRIAVLGDFGGRSNRGELSIGDELASRKPHRIDVDNLDEVMERFNIDLSLDIADAGGNVSVKVNSMDDFHPDELYEQLPLFEKLANLRKKLQDPASFAGAAKLVNSLLGEAAVERQRPKKSFGTSVPNKKLDSFSDLITESNAPAEETPIVDLLKQVIGPHLVAADDPQQEQMLASVDEALSASMRNVLHHPDFQSMESLWRSVELLVRRLETDEKLQIVLYDVTAEEWAADLSSSENLEDTGLFRLLVENPAMDELQGPVSTILGSYIFDLSPPHADLLGRMARIAAAAHAPFIASISNECLKKQAPEEVHPLVTQSWQALRELPESQYVMLTIPRFLLRWPYGQKTDPIDPFDFEEFTRQSGVSGMLWANSCFLAGLLVGETYRRQGLKSMELGSIMSLDDMPFYYYHDEYGDQIPLPCTDRLLSERLVAFVSSQNFAPVVGIKGRPEVRLGSFRSLFGDLITGAWKDKPALDGTSSPPPPVSGVVEPAAAPAESAEMDDLDALLDDLGLDPEPAAAESSDGAADNAPADEASEPDDLDALLAELDAPAPATDGGEGDVDEDLAALLADL